MAPTPVLLPGESHGRRSLVGCCLWGRIELDMTERLHFHFSCIGEGNGNPLQCSCLENPKDGRAWWAAVSGVSQSRTRLKHLSSSSSRQVKHYFIKISTQNDSNKVLLLKVIRFYSDCQKIQKTKKLVFLRPCEGIIVNLHSNPKERQCQRMLKLPHSCTHLTC